jgi:hypothetical protein
MADTGNGTIRDISVELISVGWTGKLRSRAYEAVPSVSPELGLRPRMSHAADSGTWQQVPEVPGATFGHEPGS